MRIKKILLAAHLVLLVSSVYASAAPPVMLFQDNARQFSFMHMPDGSFAFYNRNSPQAGPLTLPDINGKKHTLLPYLPSQIAESDVIAQSRALSCNNNMVILTPDNHVVSVYMKGQEIDKETAEKVGLPMYVDVWSIRAGLSDSMGPQMIWHGLTGSIMEYKQMPGGRIIVPYGGRVPHAKDEPPTGRHVIVVMYSDDGGKTWIESESKLTSPCYEGHYGYNDGACEPSVEQLRDGRIWMLMRTESGFLYESYSADGGKTWQKAVASRFSSSTGPANILRLKNGWLAVTWNNCEELLRHEGQDVYSGRDALHIAVSDDEGKTWRGFREIYLDHRRNDNPAKAGDRGTAYPVGSYTADGRIVILAGQGKGGRNPIIIDPEWIIQTKAKTDFSDGLGRWLVYKHYGPASRYWQARTVGCELIENPANPAAKSLHVRKADELPADSAVWNFPNGWKGTLTARIMINEGYKGGLLCLSDRMFDPINRVAENFAVFKTPLGSNGKVGNAVLMPGRWYDVTTKWNLSDRICQLIVDGKNVGTLKLMNQTLNGISYVRFSSTAKKLDNAGFLIDRVKVEIDDPYAPPCSPSDKLEHEKRYIEKMIIPFWSRK